MDQIPERGIPEKKVCLVMVTYNRFEVLLHSINAILDQQRQIDQQRQKRSPSKSLQN